MVAVQFNWQMTAPGPWDSIVAADRRAAHPVIQFETEFDPNSNTLVSITPAELTLVEGNSGELEILVNDVDGLYGFTLIVNFDSTIIQVTDANPQEADFLDSLNQFVVINSVDNEKGTIELSITQQYPATARSGSGILGKIPFQVVGQGRSEITLASVQLVKAAQADPEVLATNTNGITQPNPEVLATDINGGRVLSPFMTYLPLIEQ